MSQKRQKNAKMFVIFIWFLFSCVCFLSCCCCCGCCCCWQHFSNCYKWTWHSVGLGCYLSFLSRIFFIMTTVPDFGLTANCQRPTLSTSCQPLTDFDFGYDIDTCWVNWTELQLRYRLQNKRNIIQNMYIYLLHWFAFGIANKILKINAGNNYL